MWKLDSTWHRKEEQIVLNNRIQVRVSLFVFWVETPYGIVGSTDVYEIYIASIFRTWIWKMEAV
jgi:hypothetical protein